MKTIGRRLAVILAFAIASAGARAQSEVQPDAELTPQAVFRSASPAVVSIKVFDEGSRLVGAGSGFFVTSDGVIATNYHVLQNARSAIVVLDATTNYSVDGVVAVDAESDLALLKITGAGFPVLSLAGDDLPEIGAPVYAIGNPLGLEDTLTTVRHDGAERRPSCRGRLEAALLHKR